MSFRRQLIGWLLYLLYLAFAITATAITKGAQTAEFVAAYFLVGTLGYLLGKSDRP